MSINTRTRCSSTPSAETLVNAAGSTLRTRPSKVPAPPHRSMTTRLPTLAASASVVSSSVTTSMRCVSPTSISGVPSATAPSLACSTRKTRPADGARTVKLPAWVAPPMPPPVPPPEPVPGGCTAPSAARVCSSSCPAMRRSAAAPSTSRCAPSVASRSFSTLIGAMNPCCTSCSLRRTSFWAWSSDTWARAVRDTARDTLSCAASTRARSSRRVRSSSMAGSTELSTANGVPTATASPSFKVMRASLPASGADTT